MGGESDPKMCTTTLMREFEKTEANVCPDEPETKKFCGANSTTEVKKEFFVLSFLFHLHFLTGSEIHR